MRWTLLLFMFAHLGALHSWSQSRGQIADIQFSRNGGTAALSFAWSYKGLVKMPAPEFRALVFFQEGGDDPIYSVGGASEPELASQKTPRKSVPNKGKQSLKIAVPVGAQIHDYRVEMWLNGHLVGSRHGPRFNRAYFEGKGLDTTWWIPKAKAQNADFGGRVNKAIESARTYLIAEQKLDGSWQGESEVLTPGYTALCAYALLKSGSKSDDEGIQKASAYLKANPPRRTYAVACTIMFLCALEGASAHGRVQELVAVLERRQAGGTWSYESGNGDLSNTQYAALGLWAAQLAGQKAPSSPIEVDPTVWRELGKALSKFRNVDGSFNYRILPRPNPAHKGTASMSAAGTAMALICQRMLKRDARSERLRGELGGMAKSGYAVLGRSFSPEMSGYTFYGIERVAALVGDPLLGRHDWYVEGCEALMERQELDGSFEESHGGFLAGTSFALLFFRRATWAAIDPEYDPDAYFKDTVDIEVEAAKPPDAAQAELDARFPMVEVGESVELVVSSRKVSGTVVELADDHVVLERQGRKASIPFARLDPASRVRCDAAFREATLAKKRAKSP